MRVRRAGDGERADRSEAVAATGPEDVLRCVLRTNHTGARELKIDLLNGLLGWESVAAGLRAELSMWLNLKAEDPEAAWGDLVRAQTAFMDAMRAHPSFDHLRSELERLETIETVVFPSQIFLSAGMIVRRAYCSICGESYDECDHIVGRPYWGELCRRVLTEVEGNHIAIVKRPANKHCRITHFSDAGGKRNRMTWRWEASPPGEGETAPGGLLTEATVLSSDDTDVVRF